jgi:MoaA/NifB/PqqE/SkfB family radical SAM enzyme
MKKCRYCPTRLNNLNRPKGFSRPQVEDAVLAHITNTKDEILWLNGWGEPLMHPYLEVIIDKFVGHGIPVGLNTNGVLLTPTRLKDLINNGISKVILSVHSNESIENLPDLEKEYEEFKNILTLIQLKDNIKLKTRFTVEKKKLRKTFYTEENPDLRSGQTFKVCSFLHNREYVVLFNGNILRCCDSWRGPVLGNILNTSDVVHLENEDYYLSKCANCEGYGNWEKETERVKKCK